MELLWKIIGITFVTCVQFSHCATDNFYTAAVVEYNPSNPTSNLSHTERYISLLAQLEQSIDVIVFPEATLSVTTEVPTGSDGVNPCDDDTREFPDDFHSLSCAARLYSTYLVVNLNEQAVCTAETQAALGDDRPCSSTGYSYYNTDVVFDRNGTVVSRYRKFNLFGEFSKNKTLVPDISTFTTDFNVTFGLFTCFDLAFETPAIALVRNGIRNIIFPTMWFSELPFLTALQAQQMFAHSFNVNFLSSGANSPVRGSGGTGIFQGIYGPVVYDYIEEGGTRVYVAEVGKTPEDLQETNAVDSVYEQNDDSSAELMDGFTLIRDQVDAYNSVLLNTSQENTVEELCYESDGYQQCCQFNITVSVSSTTESDYYKYRLVAYSGVRSYTGMYNGGVEICGIIACTDTDLASCANRFSNYSEVSWPVTFQRIEIRANYTDIHSKAQYPNSLLSNILPVYPNSTEWTTVEYEDEELIERTFVLNQPQDRLLSFAIYGRDFARDSDPFASSGQRQTVFSFGAVYVVILLLKFVS